MLCQLELMKTTHRQSYLAPSLLRRFFKGFFSFFEKLVPAGYQDTSGFHYGVPPLQTGPWVHLRTQTASKRSRHQRIRRREMDVCGHPPLVRTFTLL